MHVCMLQPYKELSFCSFCILYCSSCNRHMQNVKVAFVVQVHHRLLPLIAVVAAIGTHRMFKHWLLFRRSTMLAKRRRRRWRRRYLNMSSVGAVIVAFGKLYAAVRNTISETVLSKTALLHSWSTDYSSGSSLKLKNYKYKSAFLFFL